MHTPDSKEQNKGLLMERALELLDKGLHIFPLGAYGEAPPVWIIKDRFEGDIAEATAEWPKQPRVAWKPYQTEAPTESMVRAWWTQWPEANIGLACGELIVVDADSAESVSWCRTSLPHTPWRVKTGKGMHFYYRRNPFVEIRNSADPHAKIDTRGLGGYVVAGGSRHCSGNYYTDEIDPEINHVTASDLPMLEAAQVAAIEGYRRANIGAATPVGKGNLAGFDADRVHEPARFDQQVPVGGRNNAAASLAGTAFQRGLSLRETKKILDDWNANNPQSLSDAELNTTIASVKRTHEERNHVAVPLEPPKIEGLEQYIVSLDALDREEPQRYLVHDWIPEGEVTLLAGHGGGGKSYIALLIAVHVALGRPVFGIETRAAPVLFFSAEDGAQIIRNRVFRICISLDIDPNELKGRLSVLDASDLDSALHRDRRGAMLSADLETPMMAALSELVERLVDGGLVIVDNASDAFDDDEIKRPRVRAFIRSLRSRLARPKRAVLLLAHINKESAKNGARADPEAYSGSTAWHNSVRSRLALIPDEEAGTMTLYHAKANLGPRAAPVTLEWIEGVPILAGERENVGKQAADAIRTSSQDAQVIACLDYCDKNGIVVNTAINGHYTAFHSMRLVQDFPKGLGPDALARVLLRLVDEGRVHRGQFRTPDRKLKEVFTRTPSRLVKKSV